MEMEVIAMVKGEKVMPENWHPASEMRDLTMSSTNKITHDLVDEAMKEIQKKAKNGTSCCCVIKDCVAEIADAFMEILTTLGYTVSQNWHNGYVFDIRW